MEKSTVIFYIHTFAHLLKNNEKDFQDYFHIGYFCNIQKNGKILWTNTWIKLDILID